jgi:dipeptidyl aminopeptidase/acylaminoacyl peptidase
MSSSFALLSSIINKKNIVRIVYLYAAYCAYKKYRQLSESKHSQLLINNKQSESKLVQHIHGGSFFENKQGLWIHYRRWTVSNPKGVIFIMHGAFEHIDLYNHIAESLNEQGFDVYGLDHQGHGQSDGDPAYVEQFSDYVDDAVLFVQNIQRNYKKQLPNFILGHSMGGLITLLILMHQHKVQ